MLIGKIQPGYRQSARRHSVDHAAGAGRLHMDQSESCRKSRRDESVDPKAKSLCSCAQRQGKLELSNWFASKFHPSIPVKRVRWWCMAATPFLTFYVAGLIFDSDTMYMVKMLMLACVYCSAYFLGKTMFDDHLMSLLPLSVYMATKFWFYVTWTMYFADTLSPMVNIAFFLCSGLLWLCFLRSWRGDPGIIQPTKEQRFRVSFVMLYE